MTDAIPSINRRQFFKLTVGTGVGLTLGVSLGGCDRYEAPTVFKPSLWLRVGEDETITVFLAESEMGQGVITALPMLVAEELEVSLDAIEVEYAPLLPDYGHQITGGSNSVRDAWQPLRQAGAMAREMLRTAASEIWRVSVEECIASDGQIHRRGMDIKLSYGELAGRAARLPIPEEVLLKEKPEYKLLGRDMPQVNALDKVTGRSIFGADVSVDGMLVATIMQSPVFGGTLESFDETLASNFPGVRAIVPMDNAIAVVAESYWQASKALNKIAIQWNEGAATAVSSDSIETELSEALKTTGTIYTDEGGATAKLGRALDELRLSSQFMVPFQAHAAMEPLCCVASVADGKCEIWVATQAPSNARDVAFDVAFSGANKFYHKVRRKLVLGFEDPVKVNRVEMGGGFGRRLTNDFVAQAVKISMAVNAPVKLIWSREEDIQHDFYRPMTVHQLEAALTKEGTIDAWSHRFAGPDARPGGARNIPYATSAIYVEGHDIETPVPVGPWRSIDHSYNGFVVECFIDELAEKAKQDPVEFRLSLLSEDSRLAHVLRLAADRAGWFEGKVEGQHLGVAAHPGFGSYVAMVAKVSVNASGRVRVHRLVCAMDCGQMINPDSVKAQVEGAIIFALTSTLKSSVTVAGGRVQQSNFHDFQLLRIDETPQIEILLVDSDERPGGVGETAVPPVAPAIANAVFAATGKRQRSHPFGTVVTS